MSDPSPIVPLSFYQPQPIASHFLAALCFQVENYFRSFMMRKLYENHGEFALQGMPASRVHNSWAPSSELRVPDRPSESASRTSAYVALLSVSPIKGLATPTAPAPVA